MKKILLLVISLFGVSSVIQGQLIPVMINLPETPLQFVSIKSDTGDYMETVTVKNVSDRDIASFQIGLIMSIPAPCSPTPDFGDERVLRIDRIAVPAGQTAVTHNYGISPQILAAFDRSGLRRIVMSQIAVTSVTFSDGSGWQSSRTGQMYDDSSIKRMANMYCSASVVGGSSDQHLSANRGNRGQVKSISLSTGSPEPLVIQSFNCVCGPLYGCSVTADDKSCTSSICSGEFCQNQICHPADLPNPVCPVNTSAAISNSVSSPVVERTVMRTPSSESASQLK